MIDTDKYEGHSKGDNELGWRINNNFVSNDKCPNDRYIAYVQGDKVMEFSDADANLIADAPLLLAEVKRLREGIKVYLKITDERPHNYIHENREKLRELIE